MSNYGDDDDDDDDDAQTIVGQAKHLLPAHLHDQIGQGSNPLPAAGRPAVPTPPPPTAGARPPLPPRAPSMPGPLTAPVQPIQQQPLQQQPMVQQPMQPMQQPGAVAQAYLPAPLPPMQTAAARGAPTMVLPRQKARTPLGFLIYMTTCVVLTAAGVGVLVLFKLQGRW